VRSRSLSIALFSILLFIPLAAHAANLEVEGPQDSLAGPEAGINHCTLRKAIINANTDSGPYPQCLAGSGADTITFLFPGTITTQIAGISEDAGATGDYDITQSLTIIGHPDGTTIDGADLDRLFHVNPAANPGVVVTLRNIRITNGNGLGSAGGILVSGGTLNLENVTIDGCSVNGGDGSAVFVSSGATLNMTNCTISGNTAAHYAAVLNDGGIVNITNCTIAGNSSSFSNLTGGIRSLGTTNLRNTIVADNSGTELPNLDGAFNSLGYNIIGELGTAVGNPTIAPTTGDQFDVNFTAINLGPLQNNGGPTPTRALGAGSIALDKGHSSGSTSDQRGLTRPCDGASITNAAGGDGGDVGAYEEQLACVANANPDAVDDNASVAEDSGANAINVLANDTDANADVLTIVSVTQGAHGSVAITGGGTGVSYTPAANYFGSDSFTYTIDDGNGGGDTATVSVNVTSVNDVPVANGDNYAINQDTTLSVAAPGVLANDSDVEGPLHAVLNVDAAHGDLTLNADGSFTYQPDPGYAGTDSFTYHVFDGTDSSNIVTVTINIADTQPPTINASVAVNSLWPPNHQMVDVGLTIDATDNTGTANTSYVVMSNEDDGDSPDAGGNLFLRAERAGTGAGRVYLIIVKATDSHSNTSYQCVSVVVPKSQSAKDISGVNAQAAAAVAQCPAPAGYFVVGN